MAKGRDPQTPAPAAPAAAPEEGGESFDFPEVIQDLSQQIAGLTVELAAARSAMRRMRKENDELKSELVEKSRNVG